MLLLILFAFLAGVITILSPCILPILPIILSGSVGAGKQRPLGIVAGFVLSFTFFTLALSAIVKATGVSPDILRLIAIGVLFVFGLSLLISQTQVILEKAMSYLMRWLPTGQNQSGFFGGLTIGVSLGLLWAPCVGPILASVITLALTSSVTTAAVLITLAYSIGTAIPMFAIMYGGRALLQRVPWLLANTAGIQKGFGVVMILTSLAIALNLDRQFQTFVIQTFPQYGTGLTAIESNTLIDDQLDRLRGERSSRPRVGLQTPGIKAPEITGESWLNSPPLSLAELEGKVVLVDFWTYTCINCIRTFPYLKEWYEKYKDQGFVIVGVHSPEFEFEKSRANVEMAAEDFGITYPIVQDNDFAIWQRFRNQYWPAHYLIDAKGNIRYTHFGEGKYAETESAIQMLLEEAGQEVTTEVSQEDELRRSSGITPETYLGVDRLARFAAQPVPLTYGQDTFTIVRSLPLHSFGYAGTWDVGPESASAGAEAVLELEYRASKVFLVITPSSEADEIVVKLDGQPIEVGAGSDIIEGRVTVTEPTIYELVNTEEVERHRLRLEFLTPGTQVFAFTFG